MKDYKQEAMNMLNDLKDPATLELLYRLIYFEWLRRKE